MVIRVNKPTDHYAFSEELTQHSFLRAVDINAANEKGPGNGWRQAGGAF
jgi:hypothetical protein